MKPHKGAVGFGSARSVGFSQFSILLRWKQKGKRASHHKLRRGRLRTVATCFSTILHLCHEVLCRQKKVCVVKTKSVAYVCRVEPQPRSQEVVELSF